MFRRFEKLHFLTTHSQSGMPLTKEFRLFFLKGELMAAYPYWGEGEYDEGLPDLALFTAIGKKIDSNFFTMDVAQKENGDWMIMELGDGQVAGLPERADIQDFYQRMQ